MSFRIGLVGLCTSHPDSWIPIIREYSEAGLFDAEIVAAWDSGETRPEGYVEDYCPKMNIPHAVRNLRDMLDLVDGVIVHTANWDRHIEQAEMFVEAGKAVYIDKPIAGNLLDANQYLDWVKQGYRVTGGSVLRYFQPAMDFLAVPESERGKVQTAYTTVGVDDFNYGIHGYAILASIMGPGIVSAQYLGSSNQKQIMLEWKDGRIGLLTAGKSVWLPFTMTVTTDRQVVQMKAEELVYRAMIRQVMPYFTGKTEAPPIPSAELIEPELAAMAARISWLNHGQKVFLTDLRQDDPGFDGTQFALEYRRSRLNAAEK
ncbi:MAG: Gfo/Idh/MocA family oxidoreductase [Lentisphaeria bacterium]|nr:Gfo/Idh/MocA family oxidoreductase [Lentisphaeria bacterium]